MWKACNAGEASTVASSEEISGGSHPKVVLVQGIENG